MQLQKNTMKPTDQVININESDYKALIDRVLLSSLDEQDRNWVVTILQTFQFIQGMLEQKR